jgi:serine/threonine protein kinase
LKRIKAEDGIERAMREFEAEAAVLVRLRHPHIVTFYGVYCDTTTNDNYLTLEWANEGSLERYLRTRYCNGNNL